MVFARGTSEPQGDEASLPQNWSQTFEQNKNSCDFDRILVCQKHTQKNNFLTKKQSSSFQKPNACLRFRGTPLTPAHGSKQAGSIALVPKPLSGKPEVRQQPEAHQMTHPRSLKDSGCAAVGSWSADRDIFTAKMHCHISNEHNQNQQRFQSVLVSQGGKIVNAITSGETKEIQSSTLSLSPTSPELPLRLRTTIRSFIS